MFTAFFMPLTLPYAPARLVTPPLPLSHIPVHKPYIHRILLPSSSLLSLSGQHLDEAGGPSYPTSGSAFEQGLTR